ncbi:MAG: hypothetical protein A3K03_10110 [Bdellovibrionales bacterium RIFOXYD1_FULL_44_7]|nr:MAG: hypothetical protein A3K03_10110 [Bdellovibrionales bacterium RIFOXYD1_FULL_44_7]
MDPRGFKEVSIEELLTPKKAFWKERHPNVWAFFCPFCRAERRLPYNPRPGRLKHYIQVGLTAIVFTCVTWKWFQFKGLVSFLPFWAIFEIFYRTRVRVALSCPHCGFDPYLYLSDVKKAREEIENYWRKKFVEKGIPYPEKDKTKAATASPDSSKVVSENPNLTETRTGR